MLTVHDAARMSGRNPETVRRWIREGKLRSRKFGTQHMIDEDDLDAYLKELGVAPVPPAVGSRLDPADAIRQARADRPLHIREALAPYVSSREAPAATPVADDWLPAIVGRIVRLVDPARIVLFGSRATGHPRPDSDYDLLVVLDDVGHRRETRIAIAHALADLPISKDVIVATRAETEDRAHPVGVVRWALDEGRTVYERP